MSALVSTLGFGADSFLASLVLGLGQQTWGERLRLAMTFGFYDAISTLLGSLRPLPLLHPPALLTYLLCALLLSWATRSNRKLLYALPALLSVDNLFCGAPAGMALLLGLGSAAMATLGSLLAPACRRLLAARIGSVLADVTGLIQVLPRLNRSGHLDARCPWE
jgi:putative Mn2+ efflux pump MntP